MFELWPASGEDTEEESEEAWDRGKKRKDVQAAYEVYCWRAEQYYLRRAGLKADTFQKGFLGRHKVQAPKLVRRAAKEA